MIAPGLGHFACELETAPFQALFSDARLIPDLAALDAGVVLRLSDLSTERAGVVRRLNQAGIPVTAWLGLPPQQGYFFNADNAAEGNGNLQGSFRTVTPRKNFELFVTGENDGTVKLPSGPEVLRTIGSR